MKLNLKELQNFKQMLLQNEFFFKKKKGIKLRKIPLHKKKILLQEHLRYRGSFFLNY